MRVKYVLAIIVAKMVKYACKLVGHAGTNFPGNIAFKIDHLVLRKMSEDVQIIMITGTNGKTTTTRMISEVFKEAGIRHITNKGGANLLSGIISAFLNSVNLWGDSQADWAILEVDEATIYKLTEFVCPKIIVVTNFSRDQLDRYGELTLVVNKIKTAISLYGNVKLILNADDPYCAKLHTEAEEDITYYGIESGVMPQIVESDSIISPYCDSCHSRYHFTYRNYGNLGGYYCPVCGFKRPITQVKCTSITEMNETSTSVEFEANKAPYRIQVNMPGYFNIYNALAAFSCCCAVNLPIEYSLCAFAHTISIFGRMERIAAGKEREIVLVLAKNPAGFNQLLNCIALNPKIGDMALVINNKVQDSNDVSWLWDVDFEVINRFKPSDFRIFTAGQRAEDMALRLKYAGIPLGRISIIKNYGQLIDKGLEQLSEGEVFYILANYSAMMDVRQVLKKRYELKEIGQ